MKYVFTMADTIAADITAGLHEKLQHTSMVMEAECVMYPSLFLRKKGYAARLWETAEAPEEKLKIRGLCAVRNDLSLLTKRLSTDVLQMVVRDGKPQEALVHVQKTLKRMRDGRLSVDNFIISKQLHTYAPKTKSAHTTLALRIKARDPASAPALGTEIEYVIRRGAEDISERAVLPEEIATGDTDFSFSFNNQVLKPITEILGVVCGGDAKLRRLLCNEHAGQAEITTMFAATKKAAVEVKAKVEAVTAAGTKKRKQSVLTWI